MKPYIGIVHKERGGAYGITFPDAPGCFSAADEMDDLSVAAAEACRSVRKDWPKTGDLSRRRAISRL